MFKKAAAFILITAFAALPLAAQEQTPAQQRYSAMLRQGQNTATPLNSKQQYKYKTPPPSKAAPIKLATPAKKTTAKDESVYLEEDRPTRPFEILGGDAEKAKQKPEFTYLYDTSLIRAIKKNDTDRIKTLIYARADLNEKNDEGFTPLVLASEKVPLDILQMMLNNLAKVNTPSLYNVTPLMAAAAAGRADVVKMYLEYGGDPDAVDDLGMTALLHAVKNKHSGAVALLAPVTTVNINARDKNNLNPMLYAAINGDTASAKALRGLGADINVRDNSGRTPLILAAANNNADLTAEFISQGANLEDKDAMGRTALLHAALGGSTKTVQTLLTAGADKETQDLGGATPLIAAARERHIEIVKILIKAGVNINAADKQNRTALYLAQMNNDTKTEKLLIKNGGIIKMPAAVARPQT